MDQELEVAKKKLWEAAVAYIRTAIVKTGDPGVGVLCFLAALKEIGDSITSADFEGLEGVKPNGGAQ